LVGSNVKEKSAHLNLKKMKKVLFFIAATIFLILYCSCSKEYKKRKSDRLERITNSYVYSWQAFEEKMGVSKKLTAELYSNPSSVDTLFALYQSLDDLVNFEAEHFSRGEASINWYYLREQFAKNIEKLKVDISQSEPRGGLTINQHRSLVYRRFYTDLDKLDQSVLEKVSFEIDMVSWNYR
jgi:hypothetical protein